MKRLLLLAVVLLPALEIALFIWTGVKVGFLWLILLIAATGLLGIWLAKREGMETYRRARQLMQSGQPPHKEMLDGICILIGAVLLLLPGFISDVIGLFFLMPFTRRRLRVWIQALLMRLAAKNTIRVYRR